MKKLDEEMGAVLTAVIILSILVYYVLFFSLFMHQGKFQHREQAMYAPSQEIVRVHWCGRAVPVPFVKNMKCHVNFKGDTHNTIVKQELLTRF